MVRGCQATAGGAIAAAVLVGVGLVSLRLVAGPPTSDAGANTAEQPLDPAAWGSDHVGQSPPEYLTGDECLFCHRDVGLSWSENAHQLTIRPADADAAAMHVLAGNEATAKHAADVELLLGGDRQVRYLRRSEAYGKLELLTAAYDIAGDDGELVGTTDAHWDETTFAAKCAGCHTTAVDPTTQAFSAVSLDCYVCHGNVPLEHTKDTSLIHLSAVNRAAREVVSTCGQCHLRGGRSQSTGLPYPNNFLAGDNLFRDFAVDWDDAEIEKMHPGDRHIFQNVRDVALRGRTEITCLSCHDIHDQSTDKHQELTRTALCATCHVAGEPTPDFPSEHAHSAVCGY